MLYRRNLLVCVINNRNSMTFVKINIDYCNRKKLGSYGFVASKESRKREKIPYPNGFCLTPVDPVGL